MRCLSILTVALLAGTLLVGCQQPCPVAGPRAELGSVEFEQLWDATTEVLRRYRFQPDRQDRRAGVITTHPMTSGQWFEFWREDVIGRQAQVEADLHTVRRQVTVNIEPAESEAVYRVVVRVDVSRFSAPERQITTPSESIQIFSGRRPTTEGRMVELGAESYWIPLGRDSRLESQILSRIAVISGAGQIEPIVGPQS